jgi:hypothetical protein
VEWRAIHKERLPNESPSRTLVKSEVVRVHNEGLNHDVWGTGGVDPHNVNLDARWRLVITFTLRPLYPRRKICRCLFCRWFGEYKSRSWRCGEKINLFPIGKWSTDSPDVQVVP